MASYGGLRSKAAWKIKEEVIVKGEVMKSLVVSLLILTHVGTQLYAFCSNEYIASKKGTFRTVQEEKASEENSVKQEKHNNWITFDQMESRREAKWDARKNKLRAKALAEANTELYSGN